MLCITGPRPWWGYSYLLNGCIFSVIIVNLFFRAVNILPNRFLGVVGEHKGDFPIENLALSRDKKFLASCSHDQMVKFWNIESVKKEKVDIKKKAKKTDKSKFLKSSNQDDFFADLVDNTEEEKASGSKDDNDSGNHSDNDEAGSDDDDDDDDDDDE